VDFCEELFVIKARKKVYN